MEKRQRLLFRLAAILFIIDFIFSPFLSLFSAAVFFKIDIFLGFIINILLCSPSLLFAVALLMNRKDKILGIASAANIASSVVMIIIMSIEMHHLFSFSFLLLFLKLILSAIFCAVIFFGNQEHIIKFKKIILLLAAYIPAVNILLSNIFYTLSTGKFLISIGIILPQLGFICVAAILANNTYNEKTAKLGRIGSIGYITIPSGIVLTWIIMILEPILGRTIITNVFAVFLFAVAIAMIVIGLFLLPLAILYPARKPYDEINIDATNISADGYISLGKHVILCLFTFGIWNWVWIYKTTAYLNRTPNEERYDPVSKLLLCMFVPFYSIYWYYRHGGRIDKLSRSKNMEQSDMATMCLILGIFIPLIACILMQDRINSLCTARNTSGNFSASQQDEKRYENIKQLKELFDSGTITEEEFVAKKKQLLGL